MGSSFMQRGVLLSLGFIALLCLLTIKNSRQAVDLSSPPALPVPLDSTSTRKVCEDAFYTKRTLKTAKDAAVISLFRDQKGQKKFEASDITSVGDMFYVVFDNLFSIGRLSDRLPYNSEQNQLIGDPGVDSGFEAMFHDDSDNTFWALQEAVVEEGTGHLHAQVWQLQMPLYADDYTVKRKCPAIFKFTSENKGFEGVIHIRKGSKLYMLGLCEGNFCEGGSRGRTKGNGKLVVALFNDEPADGSDCMWETITRIDLSPDAAFEDYSAIDKFQLKEKTDFYRVAVTSQATSAVWLADFDATSDDPNDWAFSKSEIFQFPRDNNCDIIYCNIEGIHFVADNPNMLAAVSDKMKSGGKQNFKCMGKDQSVHTFVMP